MTTQNIYNMVDTWASGGGPYTAIKMNATDNDAGSSSLLIDLQVAGSSKFKVSKTGNVTLGNELFYGTFGKIKAESDGVFSLNNNAANGFGRLLFGGTTNAFPSLKRSTTTLQARLADDSDYAPFATGNLSVNANTGDAVLTVKNYHSAGTDADAALVLDANTGGESEIDFLFNNTQEAIIQWRNADGTLRIEAQAAGSDIDLWTGGGSTLLLKARGSDGVTRTATLTLA